MDFASDMVYECPDEEYEYVSDEEYFDGMDLSCSEDESDGKASPSFRTKTKHHWRRQDKPASVTTKETSDRNPKRWFRKADTNVVSFSFNTLVSASHMHAGDPVVCDGCQAILSHISASSLINEDSTTWTCEFCGHKTSVDVVSEEVPKEEEVTFLLEPSANATSTNELGRDETMIVFCMDTSGSMCVTTEVEGTYSRLKRRNSQLRRMDSFNTEGDSQYLPSQRRDVTYVSRLDAMQMAVEHQLFEMAQRYPHRRVALVTFNNHVRIIGDGSQEEIIVAGNKMNDMDKLAEIGSEIPRAQAVLQTHQKLSKKVKELEEGGATALGPALVVAVNIAACQPGSKVILCTDGKANIGLGNLEEKGDQESGKDFYSNLGEKALSKGVSVSVTTIEGTDCKLVHLGQLADKTGGQVNIVDPLNLIKEFGNILNDDCFATNVKAKFLVHKDLYIIDENNPDNRPSCVEFNPGNVQRNTEFTFAFARRSHKNTEDNNDEESLPKNPVPKCQPNSEEDKETVTSLSLPIEGESSAKAESSSPPEFPFQVQIEYTDRQGAKALKVITHTRPATTDRNLAEAKANLEILGAHAAKQSADLALQGEYSLSRGKVLMNQRLAWRSYNSDQAFSNQRERYRSVCNRLMSMENQLQQIQVSERETRGMTYSDDEFADEVDLYDNANVSVASAGVKAAPKAAAGGLPRLPKLLSKKKQKKQQQRSDQMADMVANMVYNNRRTTQADFQQPPPLPKRHPHKSSKEAKKSKVKGDNDYVDFSPGEGEESDCESDDEDEVQESPSRKSALGRFFKGLGKK